MDTPKPYAGPEIFRVELDHQPAILSACSLRALHPMQMGDGYGSQLVSDDSLQERQQHGHGDESGGQRSAPLIVHSWTMSVTGEGES